MWDLLARGQASGVAGRRDIVRRLLRAVLVTTVLFALYFLLPFDKNSPVSTGLALFVGLVAIACLVVWQTHAIAQAPYPLARALEALVTSFQLAVLLFSTTYFLMDQYADGTNFSEPLTRLDALYFTGSTFATVGFGDITADSQVARAIVLLQLLVDVILIGLVIRVFGGSVQTGLARRDAQAEGGVE